MEDNERVTLREKAHAIYRVAAFRPVTTALLVVCSVATAFLEGIGLTFIVPIVETVMADGRPATTADGLLAVFADAYAILGIPFTLGSIIVGVIAVMTLRYAASFTVTWFQAVLRAEYIEYLQTTAYDHALDAHVAYFDREGSDGILNALVTQAEYAGASIQRLLSILQQGLLISIYFTIAVSLAPVLTIGTVAVLCILVVVLRSGITSGYTLGEQVADANERIQTAAQAGTQGIRGVKLFDLADEFKQTFRDAVGQSTRARISGYRNQAALQNGYRLAAATAVFALVYLAVTHASLSLPALGVFLFTMFRLAPHISSLNSQLYRVERDLPHLVRTQAFIAELADNNERSRPTHDLPTPLDEVVFDDVRFSYQSGTDAALRDVSLTVERGEFVAIVGPSGAGKSSIVGLLARLYEPDEGHITADGTPIADVDLATWRSRVAVIRQQPFLFDASLRWNVTVGNRDASQAELEAVCETAQVTEFLDELPNGYDTMLGDDGVRLSGGQRQRVAIARALLKDADVLVFDEATSNLDTGLETRIHDVIATVDHEYALLVITHRRSTIADADRIYAIEDGRIVEADESDAVLAQE